MEETPGASSTTSWQLAGNGIESLQFGQVIGQGTFGKVFVGKHQISRKEYAVKQAFLVTMTTEQYELVQAEVRNLLQMNHEGIMRLETSLIWQTSCYLVMPLMIHRSCSQIIEGSYPNGLPETAIGLILKDVLNAVEYLHNRKYIHGAIKGSHILISASGAAILSGLRFTRQIPGSEKRLTFVSNLEDMVQHLNWLSPEILLQDKSGYSLNSDIYSVGITACELANGEVPYADMSPSAMLVKKLEETPPRLWDKNFLPSQESEVAHPKAGGSSSQDEAIACASVDVQSADSVYKKKSFTKDFHSFVSLCLVREASVRPSTNQVLRQRFINNYQNRPPKDLFRSLVLLKNPIVHEQSPGGDNTVPSEPYTTLESSSSSDFSWDFG